MTDLEGRSRVELANRLLQIAHAEQERVIGDRRLTPEADQELARSRAAAYLAVEALALGKASIDAGARHAVQAVTAWVEAIAFCADRGVNHANFQ